MCSHTAVCPGLWNRHWTSCLVRNGDVSGTQAGLEEIWGWFRSHTPSGLFASLTVPDWFSFRSNFGWFWALFKPV